MYSTSVYINTVKDVIPDITIWVFGSVMSDRKECTMIRSFKKAIWFLLAFSFVIGAATLTASADYHDTWTPVMRESDLASSSHVIDEGNYYLNQDLSVSDTLIVQSGTVRICLHGNKLSSMSSTGAIRVQSGASLFIEDCSGRYGAIVNSKSHGLEVFGGNVRLICGKIEAATNGVIVNRGSLLVSGGTIKGSYYGIYITADSKTETTISSGVVTGVISGIKADQGLNNILTITNGTVEASNGNLPCIDAQAKFCKVIIKDGKFCGRFDTGMKVDVTGGYYKNDSIKNYVSDGYFCRPTGKSDYPYTVVKKRDFIVVFEDGLGNRLKSEYVHEGDSATAPSAPTRRGYIFVGWDRDLNRISSESGRIVINAKWQKKKVVKDLIKVKQFKIRRKKKKRIWAEWNKATKPEKRQFDLYEIQFGRKKSFKDAETIYINKRAASMELQNLKKNKKYYFRIRRYKESSDKVHVSPWVKTSFKK